MSGSYRKAYDRVLPHAPGVADPFGVSRLANQRLDDLRRRVQNETLGHRGRKDDPLYRIRRLLTAAHERISDRGQTRLRGLLDAGDPHGEVRTAWHATETVRGIYGIESPVLALRYTLQLADDLQDESCPPEINKLGRTIARWTPQITNWHISKVTNRRHRSPQQPNQTHQTSSVRVTQLRELPNPRPSLRRETQLGPPRDRHSPLKRDEPEKLALHDDMLLVATDQGSVVGTAMAGYDGHRGWLYRVAVSPEHRRRGIGTALVRHAVGSLHKLGCVKVNLQIRADNRAVSSFYESLGFAVEERVSMGMRIR